MAKTIKCPKCKSLNVEFIGNETKWATDPKIKKTTTLNLNPLKPFTLFNHKEKVVRAGSAGVTMNKWHCKNCGRVFEKR